MTQTFATKWQMEIINILFKQSYSMFHYLELASWRNIPKTKILCIQNAPRYCDLHNNNLQMFALLSLMEAT